MGKNGDEGQDVVHSLSNCNPGYCFLAVESRGDERGFDSDNAIR